MTSSAPSTTPICSSPTGVSPPTPEDWSFKSEKKKKLITFPKIFGSKRLSCENSDEELNQPNVSPSDSDDVLPSRKHAFAGTYRSMKDHTPRRQNSVGIEGLNLSNFDQPMTPHTITQDFRVFVATWNVGGKTPDIDLRLEEFLQVEGSSDIYVLGFQEIVPLSAGNVLVVEDNEPAAKWLALISHALNKSYHHSVSSDSGSSKSGIKDPSKSHFFQKPSLKVLSKNLRADSTLLKACNCPLESPSPHKRRPRNLTDPSSSPAPSHQSSTNDLDSVVGLSASFSQLKYCLVASKKVVGLFLSVWVRKDLAKHIGHLRVDTVNRGIMGYLGNKGCISISLSLHRTSFCFVCSHLASGEKEGDELKRNNDVSEILKTVQFPRICKNRTRRMPEKIIDHDRLIWLGDLNYRVSLSYEETSTLLEDNDWDSLLEKDQLNLEREAGRVFDGWHEGKIYFAPTYKYTHNSDSYAGETCKSKKKRRTPAWCDRILWRGSGIEQLSYIRGESRFSDHRPVCAVFAVEVEMKNNKAGKFRKGNSCTVARMDVEDGIPHRHSYYGY
ncbi:type I inositol polyphosphate 5-phosphatase 5-like isoform X2 [Apium graveolens]|uniref:type I inositol polyphosphate 5-phosphatase 5-like isoform X2 n=1 Tax=Apium graveolens TaxID=4045 RepID=UPI003D78DF07